MNRINRSEKFYPITLAIRKDYHRQLKILSVMRKSSMRAEMDKALGQYLEKNWHGVNTDATFVEA